MPQFQATGSSLGAATAPTGAPQLSLTSPPPQGPQSPLAAAAADAEASSRAAGRALTLLAE
jgi:hypothetical protein